MGRRGELAKRRWGARRLLLCPKVGENADRDQELAVSVERNRFEFTLCPFTQLELIE